jgi:hypothetical protein
MRWMRRDPYADVSNNTKAQRTQRGHVERHDGAENPDASPPEGQEPREDETPAQDDDASPAEG